MATLNTMRTRWGWIVTGFIFLALIMFVVSDLFTNNGGFMGSDDVGEIAGKSVSYEDFAQQQQETEAIYQIMYNTSSIPATLNQQINDQVWNNFILDYAFMPSFKREGISVGADEKLDMVNGVYLSPVYAQFFPNQEALVAFLSQIKSNNQAFALWTYLKEQADIDRMMSKYAAITKGGFQASDIAVENAITAASTTYDARGFFVPYTSIPDSTVNISASAIKKYYNTNKAQFKQAASRDVEYVVFDLSPSESDFAAAAEDMKTITEEFRSATNPLQYAALSAKLTFASDTMYMRAANVPATLEAVANGKFAEPTLSGDTYTMARLVGAKTQPDTVGLTAITPNGEQDAGRMAIELLPSDLKANVLRSKVGDLVSFADPYGNQMEFKVTYKNAPVRLVQIAEVQYKVYPSSETQNKVYNETSTFIAAAGKTAEGFQSAVDELGLSKRTVRIRPQERTINGLTDAKVLINWAYAPKTKKGTISEMLQIDGNYVIALLADSHKEGYIAIEQVSPQIRSALINEEKARMITEKISGTTLSEMATSVSAEIQNLEGVGQTMPFISQFGYEPKVVGALSVLPQGAVSKPVAGYQGVYVVETTSIITSDESITPEAQKVRLNANATYNIEQRLMQAIYELAEIDDMRVRYF